MRKTEGKRERKKQKDEEDGEGKKKGLGCSEKQEAVIIKYFKRERKIGVKQRLRDPECEDDTERGRESTNESKIQGIEIGIGVGVLHNSVIRSNNIQSIFMYSCVIVLYMVH